MKTIRGSIWLASPSKIAGHVQVVRPKKRLRPWPCSLSPKASKIFTSHIKTFQRDRADVWRVYTLQTNDSPQIAPDQNTLHPTIFLGLFLHDHEPGDTVFVLMRNLCFCWRLVVIAAWRRFSQKNTNYECDQCWNGFRSG